MLTIALKRVEKCLGQIYDSQKLTLLDSLTTEAENITTKDQKISELHTKLFDYLLMCELIQVKLGEIAIDKLMGAERLKLIPITADDIRHLQFCSSRLIDGDEVSYGLCSEVRDILNRIRGEENSISVLLILTIAKHSTSWVVKTALEEVKELSFLKRILDDENRHIDSLAGLVAFHLNRDIEAACVKSIQRNVAVIRLTSALSDDTIDQLSPLLGGGTEENQVEFGRQKIIFMHEDMYVSRVNLLKKIGFSLVSAQKISENIGGSVKAGVGC